MTTRILAGDVGGTKTNLAIYRADEPGEVSLEREGSLPSREHPGLAELVQAFLGDGGEKISAAAFGIAGPVLDDRVRLTNLPWEIEAGGLAADLGVGAVRLLNDLETTAYGGLFLGPGELLTLQEGTPRQTHRVVIAAGTGLGQAILFWDGQRYRCSATEGGHTAFSPRNEREMELLRFLLRRFERVSWERVVSGPGLFHVFEYLRDGEGRPVSPEVQERLEREDPSAVVGQAGVAGTCPTCEEAVDFFVELYGAQAGNLALTVMALGGLYVGGGVAPKLLPKVKAGGFIKGMRQFGRFEEMMGQIPVQVILDPKTSLVGAARLALELAS